MNRKLLLTGLLSVCLFALSSRALAQDAPAMFTGKLGDHVRVAATAANGKIALFFCGDASTVSTQSHWLIDGFQLVDNALQVVRGDGWGSYVIFHEKPRFLEGWVLGPVPGKLVHWVASVAPEGWGLYRAKNELGVEGAIVTDFENDGVFELQGALKNLSGHFEQIVPIASVEPKDGALEVAVPAGGGAFSNVILHQVTTVDF